jgi:hypothetical protein
MSSAGIRCAPFVDRVAQVIFRREGPPPLVIVCVPMIPNRRIAARSIRGEVDRLFKRVEEPVIFGVAVDREIGHRL